MRKKFSLSKPSRIWEDNIKIDLKILRDGVKIINLIRNMAQS
jgi:hypothetical protein